MTPIPIHDRAFESHLLTPPEFPLQLRPETILRDPSGSGHLLPVPGHLLPRPARCVPELAVDQLLLLQY